MRIRRLKLAGFKSFVEPAELRIEAGLTGVVGPNGCGKSNLLEAIRWVMGEGSAKSMRGAGMEDVIFAGTSTRPARAFAEVVLLADDDAGEELEVVRRIERGAGSAYRINGRDARAKDVSLIFADAATGAHSPALVSQGRIAAVIAAKPAQRREMLEEAAGIAGLHVRRRDAEGKLRATEANLARLEDIVAGLDAQIAGLRRQARAAERYTALSDRIKTAEARLVFARWRDAAAAAEAARVEAAAAEVRVTEAQGAAKSAQEGQASAAAAYAEARDTLADRRDDASSLGHRMASLTGQLEGAEQRLTDLDRQAQRLEEDRADADRLTRDAADALARLEQALTEGRAALAAEEARRPALERAMEEATRAERAQELALAQAAAAQAGVEAEWRIADAECAAALARLTRSHAEADRHARARAALEAEADPALAIATAEAEAKAAEQRLTSARAASEAHSAARETLAAAREGLSVGLAQARAELATTTREAEALTRDKAARDRQAATKGGRSAISALRVAPGYERAVSAVLGRDASAPLGAVAAGDGRFWTGATPPAPAADSLIAHVSEYPEELAARLALARFAETDEGQILAPGEWLVTRAGHLRRWDGFVARGEGAAEAARLEADNRLAELAARLPAQQAAAAQAEADLAGVAGELAAAQAALKTAEAEIAEASRAEREALRALDAATGAAARRAQRLAEMNRAAGDLAREAGEASAAHDAAVERRAGLPDPELGRAALAAARGRNEAARAALQGASAALAAHDQALAVARERAAAQGADIRGWQARAGDAAKRLAGMQTRAEEIAEERAVVAAKPAALIAQIEADEAVRTRIAAELAEAEAAVAAAQEQARAADAALAGVQEVLAAARETRAGAAARAENEELRRAEMGRVSGERFQCPPPLLPERFGFQGADVAGAADESAATDRLSADRERIGPVNLVAAQELAEAEARGQESAATRAELTEAVHRLRGSIGNLNREGRERLRAAFEAVDGHFRRLFERLFEGGAAHLALVDSDDPLEAGLEIYAQPPGKRLQSLTLLSGGEQALTAVALIFALFLTNPAPICVLDEVDAPLDDANIERFCDLLHAMTKETDTRYLIVTHNAVTMSRMHRLFGVTMVERGVSRLVSVDLGAAERLLTEAAL